LLLAAGLACCIFDGAVRKWFLFNAPPSVQSLPYFAKDLFLLLATGCALSRPLPTYRVAVYIQWLLIASLMIGLACLPSLSDFRPVGGLLSLRSMLVLPWLAVLLARGLHGPQDVSLLLKVFGWSAVLNALLGAAQFYLPAGHFVNARVTEDAHTHYGSYGNLSRVRATGTFPFINGMGDLAIAATWAGCTLLLRRPKPSWDGGLFLASGAVCAMAAQSRYGIFFSLAIAGITLLPGGGKARLLVILGLALALALGRSDEGEAPTLLEAVVLRHQTSDSIWERASYSVQVFNAASEHPTGNGLGSTQAAERALNATDGGKFEAEPARVVCEIGTLGLLGILLSRLSLVLFLGSNASGLNRGQPAGVACWTTCVALLAYCAVGPSFNHVSSTFLCAMTAVALASVQKTAPLRPRGPALDGGRAAPTPVTPVVPSTKTVPARGPNRR